MRITRENRLIGFIPGEGYSDMMLPAAHFVLSVGIAFCLEFRHPRKYTVVIALGIVGMLPDLDHFLPLHDGARLLHNTLALGMIPLAVIMVSNAVEAQRGYGSSKFQRFFVCVAVILASHLLLDMITGNGVYLGFPTSVEATRLISTPLVELPGIGVLAVTADALWFGILALVLAGNLVQKKIYGLFEGYAEVPEMDRSLFPDMTGDLTPLQIQAAVQRKHRANHMM